MEPLIPLVINMLTRIYILYNICHPVRVDLAYHILTCSITSPIRPYAHGNCCADIATESTPAGTNIAVSSHSILHYIQSILITPTVPTVPTVSTVATISTVWTIGTVETVGTVDIVGYGMYGRSGCSILHILLNCAANNTEHANCALDNNAGCNCAAFNNFVCIIILHIPPWHWGGQAA